MILFLNPERGREESLFPISEFYLYLAQLHTSVHTQVHTHLYVKCMCSCEAAVPEQRVKLLGEDECVWTERVSAERRPPEVRRVLHFTQAVAL